MSGYNLAHPFALPAHIKKCRCSRCFERLLRKAVSDYLDATGRDNRPVDQRALDRRITR